MPPKSITEWADKSGEFKRQQSTFRNFVSNSPDAQFPAEPGRYHLYVSYACPWAHRTLIVRKLKGLEDIISFSSVHWEMLERGWRFISKDEEGKVPGENCIPDPFHEGVTHLREIYFDNEPGYEGRFTVPVLFDKKTRRIVNNESAEIIRMLYHEFDHLVDGSYQKLDLFPEPLRKQIDEANAWHYDDINNGVYKSGFATTQEAYEKNVKQLFASLDRAEKHLAESKGQYYFGDKITETDVRLFTTIVRFDPVYVQHFKCNIKDIRSGYPHLHRWLRSLYWNDEAFKATTQFEHIRKHYTKSHKQINPHSITPVGPLPDILPEDEEVAVLNTAVA